MLQENEASPRVSIHRANHKRRLVLNTAGLGIESQTSEANVEHRQSGWRPRHDPIDIVDIWVTLACDIREGSAAIDGKHNFRLTHRQVDPWEVGSPGDPYYCARHQNLARFGRNKVSVILA